MTGSDEMDAVREVLGNLDWSPLLISLNHAYAPLHVREDDEFRVFGKVVG